MENLSDHLVLLCYAHTRTRLGFPNGYFSIWRIMFSNWRLSGILQRHAQTTAPASLSRSPNTRLGRRADSGAAAGSRPDSRSALGARRPEVALVRVPCRAGRQ